MHAGTDEVSSPQRKRARPLDASDGNMSDQPPSAGPGMEHSFVNDADAGDSAGDEDEDEGGKPADKKAGRRKIKIEFIQDKSRRHITFSKRKAGIMKKAYELSTLTGTQVLLLVVSETGLVYTFTTAKLQPLVTQPEGKNLIQACLNAPHGTLPNSMPVGPPLGRPSQIPPPPPSTTNGSTTTGSTVQSPANVMGAAGMNIRSNIAGGISIGGANAQSGVHNEDDDAHHHRDEDDDRTGSNRRRPSVVGGAAVNQQGANAPKPTTRSPTSPHTTHLTAQQQQTQAQVQGAVAASQQQPVTNSPPAGSYTTAPPAYGQPGTGAPGSEMYPGVMHSAGTHGYPYAPWPPQNVAPPGYRRS